MKRALIAGLLLAASLHAAVIRGTVVENDTSKPLMRALIVLQPLGSTPGDEQSARADRLGNFHFSSLPAGVYLLKASRRGFLPVQYGQKRWNSAGQPIFLDESASPFLHVRLQRYGAVAGTVVDENEIGLPGHDVVVYRATRPPQPVTDSKTDDRGRYRIGGLTPGKYVVRAGGGQYEDDSYLPTFSRETPRYDQAQLADVFLEQQTNGLDVRPLPGRTYTLTVTVDTDPPFTPVNITVASETGRKIVQASSYQFTGLAPGEYEIYAESLAGYPPQGAYQRISLRGKTEQALITEPPISVSVTGDAREKGELWFRRKDLAGAGPLQIIPAAGAALPHGRWELLLRPPAGFHVSGVSGPGVPRRDRPEGWNEALVRRFWGVSFRLASGAGAIRGIVKDAPYAPVYLEGYDPVARQRVGELWTARADAQGQYRFEGLAPGPYRLFATFEYAAPDTETFDISNPAAVTVDGHTLVTKDLDLWVLR